jgi:non-specific serine/threonine protein kinase
VRLLTLTGTAGIGKTRLAIELARRSADDDVWFVELATLRDERAPARALAVATGLAERRERDQLAEGLRERAGLVVLDNCEHLVHPCAELVTALLAGCPDLRILTTSREALGVAGEVVWPVCGLELPDPDSRPGARRLRACDAVAFFAGAAARRLPGFAIRDAQLTTVARICGRLDANPLALELAAARIAHLTLEEVERRLAGSSHILLSPSTGSAGRHRSLWAAIDWSYDLLTDTDRVLFQRLSVFRGGFGLDGAAAVAGAPDVLVGLSRLVDKSLVVSLATSGTPRYRLLETLREHALARLRDSGEEDAVRERHAAWYLAVAERDRERLNGSEALAAGDELELEHDNLRAALDWSLRRDPAAAARLGAALGEFWIRRGYLSEGRERLNRCLDAVDASGESPFPLLLAIANLALRQSDFAGGRRAAERLIGLSRAAGDRSAEAHGHDLVCRLALEESSLEEAERELGLAMRLFRDIEDWRSEARVHWHGNMLSLRMGDPDAARAHLARFRAIAERAGNPWATGHAHLALANLALREGDRDGIERELPLALRLLGDAGDRWALANAMRFAAARAVGRGTPDRGLVLMGVADAMDEAIGARPGEVMRRFSATWLERARRGMSADAVRTAVARGRRLTLAEAVEFALDSVDAGARTRVAAGLTSREAEVARLMAGGATDREIGTRLRISTRTVEKHAENIRSKLGVESRAEVAAALGAPAGSAT